MATSTSGTIQNGGGDYMSSTINPATGRGTVIVPGGDSTFVHDSATGSAVNVPAPSQTTDASKVNSYMSGNTTGSVFPPPPAAPTKGTSANTGVPNPIPTPQDIINQGNAQTPAEKTNQSLLEKVAALIGQKQSQQGLTNAAEAKAGVPALTKTVNDLNTQLEGLNNQALDLQNQARPGGAIENKEQQNVLGRGVTAAGLAPITAGDLRKNQIQQSAIASQALTLKSAIYGAQGQLSLAKDAADKAAQAQYEDQQNQIDYQNALIQANLPQMTKEEKNQALLVQTQLADRQTQIDNAKQDKQTIIALATAALKNNPNDPAAHYAAQQALALSNQQQPDLQGAFNLIGKYQSDPIATQQALLNLQKTRQDIRLNNMNLGLDASGKPIAGGGSVPSNLQPYYKTAYDGTPYVDLSTLSPSQKYTAAQVASANGIKPILTAEDADKISHIAVTKSNLQDIISAFNSVPVEKDIPFAQGVDNAIKDFFGDPTIRSYQDFRTSAINTLQALAGGSGSGFRITQSEIQAAIKDIPILTGPSADTRASAQAKIDNLNGQIQKWQTQILGGGNTAAKDAGTTIMTGPGGTFAVPNDQVELFKANGYK
jgi:hypothetical protein